MKLKIEKTVHSLTDTSFEIRFKFSKLHYINICWINCDCKNYKSYYFDDYGLSKSVTSMTYTLLESLSDIEWINFWLKHDSLMNKKELEKLVKHSDNKKKEVRL